MRLGHTKFLSGNKSSSSTQPRCICTYIHSCDRNPCHTRNTINFDCEDGGKWDHKIVIWKRLTVFIRSKIRVCLTVFETLTAYRSLETSKLTLCIRWGRVESWFHSEGHSHCSTSRQKVNWKLFTRVCKNVTCRRVPLKATDDVSKQLQVVKL